MRTAPTRFGNYLLDREIARGGMARVYLARLRGLGGFEKRLVVKQVLPELAGDPRFVEMFVAEAKTAVRLSHPHIVPVYELGVVEGVYFLAMEYVEGATLAEILHADGPLSPELLAHVGAELAEALAYAHERFDLVHRDVTPRNVIADAAGHTRLLDFGIAAPASEAQGGIFGTLGYLSPEQLFGEGAVGPRSDLFGLGCTLYHAASGRPPFPRERMAMVEALAAEGPRFSDLPAFPEALAALLEPTLARDSEGRPASARSFGQSLRAWLAKARPEGMSEALGERAAQARRAREQGELERERLAAEAGEEERSHARPARTGSSEVRTLATSPMLERLLREPEEGEPEEGEPEPTSSATAPIPGRASLEAPEPEAREEIADDVSEISDGSEPTPDDPPPIADDVSEKPGPEPPAEVPAEVPAAASLPAPPRRSPLPGPILLVGAALLGAALAFLALRPLGVGAGSEADARPSAERAEERARSPGQEQAQEGGRDQGQEQGQAQGRAQAPRRGSPLEAPIGAPASEPGPGGGAKRAPPPEPRALPAHLTIAATPWAEVFLDGRQVGVSPMRGLRLAPGAHRLRLHCPPLGREVSREIRAEAGAELRVRADLNADPPTLQIQ